MSELDGRSVAFLDNFAGPRMGGGEVYLLHLVRGALDAGMDVTVVSPPSSALSDAARKTGAEVIEDAYDGTPGSAGRRISSLLRSRRPVIVHGNGFWTNLIARSAGRRLGAKVVNSVLCEPDSTLAQTRGTRGRMLQALRGRWDRNSAGNADAVLAVSGKVREALLASGYDRSRVRVVYNGVDPEDVRAQAESGNSPERPGSPWAGTVGRLEAVKGLDVLLDAWPHVLSDLPGAKLTLAGDGPLREPLRRRVEGDARLRDSVVLAGFIESAPAFMRELDVYCLPSLSEGFNTTVLEACALGAPVVATAAGGTPEVIEDGVTGLLVPPGDASSLATALVRVLSNGEEAAAMAAAARTAVEERFTVAKMREGVLDAYRELLA